MIRINADSGGISLRIILILITLILVGAGTYYILEKNNKKNMINHRKALECSDYGLQQIMILASDNIYKNPLKICSIPKTKYGDGWYRVTVHSVRKEDIITITIISEGITDSQSASQEKTVILHQIIEQSGDTIWKPVPE